MHAFGGRFAFWPAFFTTKTESKFGENLLSRTNSASGQNVEKITERGERKKSVQKGSPREMGHVGKGTFAHDASQHGETFLGVNLHYVSPCGFAQLDFRSLGHRTAGA